MIFMAHYAAFAPEHKYSKVSQEKIQSHTDHVGEKVYLWGRVVQDDDTLIIDSAKEQVAVLGTEAVVDPNDAIQIYGTIQANGSLVSERVVVSEQSSLLRLYAISVVGLLLTIISFLKSWKIDISRLTLTARKVGDTEND